MLIPTNSNFSKEIAKKFKQIFHRDMTLGGLQDLQDEINMINPVDTYLQKQVSHLEKANGQETSKVANAVRQVHNERKGLGHGNRSRLHFSAIRQRQRTLDG